MNHQKFLLLMIGLALVMLSLIACAGPQAMPAPVLPAATSTLIPPTPTDTPAPPTVTLTPVPPMTSPIPSTPTSACEVKCDIDSEGYRIGITCESGQATTKLNRTTNFEADAGRQKAIKVQLDDERTYENTGNTYKIVGDISVNFEYDDAGQVIDQPVNYHITVTGGVFGDTPQICEK